MSSLNCQEIQDLIRLDEIDQSNCDEINQHLSGCPSCLAAKKRADKLAEILKEDLNLAVRMASLNERIVKNKDARHEAKTKTMLWWTVSVAACTLLILTVALLLSQSKYSDNSLAKCVSEDVTISGNHIYTREKSGTINLYDGSTVELSPETDIRIENPNGERLVRMNRGSATFEVKQNGKLFIVKTDAADIKVLGTKFIVSIGEEKMKKLVAVLVLAGMVEAINSIGSVVAKAEESISVLQDTKPKKEKQALKWEISLSEVPGYRRYHLNFGENYYKVCYQEFLKGGDKPSKNIIVDAPKEALLKTLKEIKELGIYKLKADDSACDGDKTDCKFIEKYWLSIQEAYIKGSDNNMLDIITSKCGHKKMGENHRAIIDKVKKFVMMYIEDTESPIVCESCTAKWKSSELGFMLSQNLICQKCGKKSITEQHYSKDCTNAKYCQDCAKKENACSICGEKMKKELLCDSCIKHCKDMGIDKSKNYVKRVIEHARSHVSCRACGKKGEIIGGKCDTPFCVIGVAAYCLDCAIKNDACICGTKLKKEPDEFRNLVNNLLSEDEKIRTDAMKRVKELLGLDVLKLALIDLESMMKSSDGDKKQLLGKIKVALDNLDGEIETDLTKKVDRLIKQLDDNDPETRENATIQLIQRAKFAKSFVKKLVAEELKQTKSTEVKTRCEQILSEISKSDKNEEDKKWIREGICETNGRHVGNACVGTCSRCIGRTGSGSQRICYVCSKELGVCQYCLKKLKTLK